MAGSWRDALDAPPEIRERLPRGYDIVGHVVILHLADPLSSIDPDPGFGQAVANALLETVPPARTAAIDQGVEGEIRTRKLEVIGGEPNLVAEHKENGLRLLVDLDAVYFSPRLAGERARVGAQVQQGERVLDMYAGVGPYAVLAAKRGAIHVLAVDVNPEAIRWARENAQRNKVHDRLDTVVADAPALASALPARFDRIIMNLPHDAPKHLAHARAALAPGGTIHLGAMLAKDEARELAATLAQEHGFELRELVHVRNYNPAVGHYCLDLVDTGSRAENG